MYTKHTHIYIHPIKLSHIACCSLQGSLHLGPMKPWLPSLSVFHSDAVVRPEHLDKSVKTRSLREAPSMDQASGKKGWAGLWSTLPASLLHC